MSKLFLFFLFSFSIVHAQEIHTDSIAIDNNSKNLKFNYKQLIIPTVFISYGVAGLGNGKVKEWDEDIQQEVLSKNHGTTGVDDYLQYLPAV